MYFKFNKKGIKNGFTLVEALVAISILMVAVVTPMTIAQKGLGSANYSKDQMTAAFLAQDALEFIKNQRDEIGVTYDYSAEGDPPDWLTSKMGADCFSSGCGVDTVNNTYEGSDKLLNIYRKDGKFFYYGYEALNTSLTSEVSKFIRNIKIEKTANLDEALIAVTVKWQGANGEEKVEVKNFIYNYWENI